MVCHWICTTTILVYPPMPGDVATDLDVRLIAVSGSAVVILLISVAGVGVLIYSLRRFKSRREKRRLGELTLPAKYMRDD